MAGLTQSLYDVEEQLKHRGFQARMVKPPNNPREAGSGAFARLQGEEPVSESSQELRRRFLRRLTLALVSYGSSATRTEYLIKNASKRLNVKTKIAVLNSLVILLFPDRRDASKEEIHLMKLNGQVDVDKLQQIDELANSVGLPDTPVMMGQWRLQTIVRAPSTFEEWFCLIVLSTSPVLRNSDTVLSIVSETCCWSLRTPLAHTPSPRQRNVVAAALVVFCKQSLAESTTARAILINAGQANAATGDAGYQDTLECTAAVAKNYGVPKGAVLIESTGVIGHRIMKGALLEALPKLVDSLSSSVGAADAAAVAITTTDLVSKSVAIETKIGGATVRLGGVAKGSGTIHLNMATMLGIDVWRPTVLTAMNKSFNQITVDGDSSINYTLLALASGAARGPRISNIHSEEARQLQAALDAMGLARPSKVNCI